MGDLHPLPFPDSLPAGSGFGSTLYPDAFAMPLKQYLQLCVLFLALITRYPRSPKRIVALAPAHDLRDHLCNSGSSSKSTSIGGRSPSGNAGDALLFQSSAVASYASVASRSA